MAKRKDKKIIYRNCLVCGKKIRIIVYRDGHYTNSRYFSKLKIPLKGTGKYKKVGTSELLGKKVDVIKWTGKEKEVEYWECSNCYEEALHETWLEEIIEKLYGKRCPDYEKGCACCQAWNVYDTIIDENRGRL